MTKITVGVEGFSDAHTHTHTHTHAYINREDSWTVL